MRASKPVEPESHPVLFLEILKILLSSKEDSVPIGEFMGVSKAALNALSYISRSTKAVGIEEDHDVSWETGDEGESYASGGSHPVAVNILDREKLKNMRLEIDQELRDVYEKKIPTLLARKSDAEWRCVKCRRFLDKLNTREKIIGYLDDFFADKPKACHKCRTKNIFAISSSGELHFESIKKSDLDSAGGSATITLAP